MRLDLTPEQLEAFEHSWQETPRHGRMWQLIAEYAEQTGGLTLQYWRRAFGPAFGEAVINTHDEVARELGIAPDVLKEILGATWDWVGPRLDSEHPPPEGLPSAAGPAFYAAFDGQLLPLARELGGGRASELVELARERTGLGRVAVARWMWSAHDRGFITSDEPTYGTFRVV